MLRYQHRALIPGVGLGCWGWTVGVNKNLLFEWGITHADSLQGFFRRSIQKQIEYRCLRDGKCMVFRLNRNRCQYCRFKKCLAVGMSRDSVRYGRVPKRSRPANGGVDGCADGASNGASASSPNDHAEVGLYVSRPSTRNCADRIGNRAASTGSVRCHTDRVTGTPLPLPVHR
jgi:nuclear receptor subfamily 1 group D protein 3